MPTAMPTPIAAAKAQGWGGGADHEGNDEVGAHRGEGGGDRDIDEEGPPVAAPDVRPPIREVDEHGVVSDEADAPEHVEKRNAQEHEAEGQGVQTLRDEEGSEEGRGHRNEAPEPGQAEDLDDGASLNEALAQGEEEKGAVAAGIEDADHRVRGPEA